MPSYLSQKSMTVYHNKSQSPWVSGSVPTGGNFFYWNYMYFALHNAVNTKITTLSTSCINLRDNSNECLLLIVLCLIRLTSWWLKVLIWDIRNNRKFHFYRTILKLTSVSVSLVLQFQWLQHQAQPSWHTSLDLPLLSLQRALSLASFGSFSLIGT